MASSPAISPQANPAPPDADPVAIRACLSQRLVAEFDADWDFVLEQARASKDLAGVHNLPQKWRHRAYAEVLDVLAVTPWNGEPQHERHPDAPVRGRTSGRTSPARRSTSSSRTREKCIYCLCNGSGDRQTRELHGLDAKWA